MKGRSEPPGLALPRRVRRHPALKRSVLLGPVRQRRTIPIHVFGLRCRVDSAQPLPGCLSEGERVSSGLPARRPARVARRLDEHLGKDCVRAPPTLLNRHIVSF